MNQLSEGPVEIDAGASRMPLTEATLVGVKWTYSSIAISAVVQVTYLAAMARLIAPGDFGLVAMTMVVINFGRFFSQMGTGPALIQKSSLARNEIRTAATATVLLSIVVAILIVALAPSIADLFGTDEMISIVRVLSLSLILAGLSMTSVSLLRRRLEFQLLAKVEVVSSVIAFLGVGLIAALLGMGIWSLVAAHVAYGALEAVAAYYYARHPLRPRFDISELRPLLAFGVRLSLVAIVGYFGSSLDTWIIGRFSGATLLGYYNRAHTLVHLPFSKAATGLSKVLFPAFSRIQNESERLLRGYVGTMRIVSAILLPTAAGMAAAAPQLVDIFLGPQWVPAATVLPALAIAITFHMLSHFAGVICDVTGTLRIKLTLETGYVLLLAALLLLVSSRHSLPMYASAVALAAFVRQITYIAAISRVLGYSFTQHLLLYVAPTLTAAATGLAIWTIGSGAIRVGIPNGFVWAMQVMGGTAILMIALWFGPLKGARYELLERLMTIWSGESATKGWRGVAKSILAIGGPG